MNFRLTENAEKTLRFINLIEMNKSFAYKNLQCGLTFSETDYGTKHVCDKSRKVVVSSFMLFCLALFLLAGCSSTYAPVEQRTSASYKANSSVKKIYTGKIPTYHRVKKGETLYYIAWKYGQDYKTIAYRNKIKPPYRIFTGDKLRLTALTAKKTKVLYSSGRKDYSKSKESKPKGSDKVNRKKSSSKTRTASKSSKKAVSKTASSKTKKTASYTGSKQLRWSWPVKGKIIQWYSPGSGKKGIDISAAKGTLIKAAEAGKVVYSGQGLVGYGRLIIIKHNDTFLSAYAHNQSLLVNEGQIVKKGQGIARLGRSGTDGYKLHFEIRKNGKPVNPVSYLPR